MTANADTIIQLVEGAVDALARELEEAFAGPWTDELRDAVRGALESGIGPAVADVVVAFADALRKGSE